MPYDPTRRSVNRVERTLEDYDTLADVRAQVEDWIAENGEAATVSWYSDHVEITVTRPETDSERDARLEAFQRDCDRYEIAIAVWNRLTEDERRAMGYTRPLAPQGYQPRNLAPTLSPESGRIPE